MKNNNVEMSDKKKLTITATMAAATLLCFVAGAYKTLIADNSETLFMAQTRSFFNFGSKYFNESIAQGAGFLQWVSSFLTQFFYEPALGGSILIGILLLTTVILKYALRLKWIWYPLLFIPVAAIIASDVSLGYWLYYVKLKGFMFTNAIGLLSTALLTLAFTACSVLDNHITNRRLRLVGTLATIIIALTFPLFGFYTLLALALIAALAARERQWITLAVSIICVAIVPRIAYNFIFTTVNSDYIYITGIPDFDCGIYKSTALYLPYIIMAVSVVLIALIPRHLTPKAKWQWYALPVAYIALISFSAYEINNNEYDNANYKAELSMYHAVCENRWDDALRAMDMGSEDPTREMVLLKTVSLANLGTLGSDMFRYANTAEPPYVFDSLKVHLIHTAAPLIYMHHGRINFAQRWCIENGVEFGFHYDDLKILAVCSIINKEYGTARKYLDLLTRTIYYKEWAEDYLKICDEPKLIAKHHELDKICELNNFMTTDLLDSDQSLPEKYLIHYFAQTMNKDSKYFQELTLIYAMVTQDIQLFWPRFFLYANLHNGEEMPIHYQEAAYLYGNLEHSVDISKMPFDNERIKQRYAAFMQEADALRNQGLSEEAMKARMRVSYGDTFWWFYFFARNMTMY